MDTLEHRLLERIDTRTQDMAANAIRLHTRLEAVESDTRDHEVRLRALEDFMAGIRSDMRRWTLIVTALVLGGLGVGGAVVSGALDKAEDTAVAAPSEVIHVP